MNGVRGQIVQQHVVKEFKHDQGHVHMMLKTLASHSLSKRIASFLQQIGDLGQVALRYVVKGVKQELEHALITKLNPFMSQRVSRKFALFPQPAGAPGQVALQPAVMVAKQELEHVLIIPQAQAMSRKLTKKLASFKNAVMTLGQHGLHGTHVRIMGLFHLNNNVRDVNSSKYRRVHKRVNRFKLNLKRRIVKIQ